MRTILTIAMLVATTTAIGQSLDDGFTALKRLDFSTAHEIFETHAQQGDAEAQIELGLMLAIGEGVPENKVEAC